MSDSSTRLNTGSISSEKAIYGKAQVIDGDTIKINGKKIRLFGIDAPEKKQICQKIYMSFLIFNFQKDYKCGEKSTLALTNKIKDKKIKWEVSNQKSFQKILVSGNAKAKFDDNFTVKVDAQIPSNFNGKTIYYRFSFQGIVSDIGTTKTLPINNPNKFNIAFCSCSNYPAGYFNAYKEMANDEEVDLVLHLGDYLYEYSREGYTSSDAKKMGRVVNPPNEIISLDDYRKRYATYRSDTDLQLLHQSKPMIAVWDDHEITNDTWKKGAQNHSSDEAHSIKERIMQ